MLQELTRPILARAEAKAAEGAAIEDVLPILRKLSLDDFGRLIISMPNPAHPALSSVLPAMASDHVQKTWTGTSGIDLLKQTLAFTKLLETNFLRLTGRPLQKATILDFGCGYGRFIRALYYFTDPANIWGMDAWDKSLEICREVGLRANFAQSDRVPTSLPVGDTKFDLAFAFSVFTHLEPETAKSCLAAIRKHVKPGGLFIPTIRPVEFWPYLDQTRGMSEAKRLTDIHHKTGVAYLPHNGEEGKTYGDTSLTPSFFNQEGWKVVAYDSSVFDSFQISIILQAVEIPAVRVIRRKSSQQLQTA